MNLWLVLLVQFLNHTCYKGSKVLLTLFALHLGASPFLAGVLFAMYSVLPALLSVIAGKVSDRVGYRAPMLFGSVGMLAGMLMPWMMPGLMTLLFSAMVIGGCYIFYTVSVQHLVGSMGQGAERTRNYSWYSLCVGFTSLAGPVLVGFSIEGLGHPRTYLLMAGLPVVPALLLAFVARTPPPVESKADADRPHRVMDLIRLVPLRKALITGGILETGSEIGNFLLPVYAESVGLSPSRIGLVVGALAVALILVRALLPVLVRYASEEVVLGRSLVVAGLACVVFPFVEQFVPLMVIAFIMGLGIGCGAPLSMLLVYNRSPEGRSGEAMGLRHTVNKATEACIPVVLGSVSTLLGMLPVFAAVAVLLGVGGLQLTRDSDSTGKNSQP
jgi:MFS family permease